jgi:hypothetical protein
MTYVGFRLTEMDLVKTSWFWTYRIAEAEIFRRRGRRRRRKRLFVQPKNVLHKSGENALSRKKCRKQF